MTLPFEEDSRPPYMQAAAALRAEILEGRLAPGDKLPTARELQDKYRLASSTIQSALRVLKDEGLIYSVQSRGSYVRQRAGSKAKPGIEVVKRRSVVVEAMSDAMDDFMQTLGFSQEFIHAGRPERSYLVQGQPGPTSQNPVEAVGEKATSEQTTAERIKELTEDELTQQAVALIGELRRLEEIYQKAQDTARLLAEELFHRREAREHQTEEPHTPQ
ncbi:winged helix-turn-helix domain-containing protein [Kitasatospora sp. NPDC049258]|uniref:GntR family transcriptional regulator n=1 Tax=Kitasatospora sp. NPDC049258 TaxID=3155394 RepID=UPI00341D112B